MRNGIDCASKITPTVAKGLMSAGYDFACRYLVPSRYSKWLSPEEAQVISDAGLDILSVYESTADRAKSGYEGGKADALVALECAKNVKQPGGAIYFAVDFQVTTTAQLDTVEQYLKGAALGLLGTPYAVGVYGQYLVIEEMVKRKAAKHFWQTYAWSNGQRSKSNNVYQYKNGQTVAGIAVDLNNSFGNEGFWHLREGKQKLTDFKDIPAGHWAESAIAQVSSVLKGYPDGTFGLGKPLTREEFAVILVRLGLTKEAKQ